MRDPLADLSGLPACSTYTSPQLVPTPPVVKIECLLEKLTPEQVNVLKTLCVGRSIAEAAEMDHVHRGTIHRWLKHDPDFRAAFNAWKEETFESARSLMVRMIPPAMDTLLLCVRNGQLRAAITVLKTMGLLDKEKPGLTDPQLLDKEMQVDRRRQRADVHKRAIETFVDETSCFPDVADKTMKKIFELVDEDGKEDEAESQVGEDDAAANAPGDHTAAPELRPRRNGKFADTAAKADAPTRDDEPQTPAKASDPSSQGD